MKKDKDIVLYIECDDNVMSIIKSLKTIGFIKRHTRYNRSLTYFCIFLKFHDMSITLIDFDSWAVQYLKGEIKKKNIIGISVNNFVTLQKINLLIG